MSITVSIPANPKIASEVCRWLDEHASWSNNEWEVNMVDRCWRVTFVDEQLATAFLLRWS